MGAALAAPPPQPLHAPPPPPPPCVQVHGRIRRFTSPDENPFFPEDVPALVLPPITYDQVGACGGGQAGRAVHAGLPCSWQAAPVLLQRLCCCDPVLQLAAARRSLSHCATPTGAPCPPARPPAAQVLAPCARVNINPSILSMYLEHLLPEISAPGDDHNYGSSAMNDVTALQVRGGGCGGRAVCTRAWGGVPSGAGARGDVMCACVATGAGCRAGEACH